MSAEIIVITLGTASSAIFSVQVATLVFISIIMTIGVYGLEAGIVKLDDAGLHLSQPADGSTPNALSKSIGAGILWFAPPTVLVFLKMIGIEFF